MVDDPTDEPRWKFLAAFLVVPAWLLLLASGLYGLVRFVKWAWGG